jgi:hypothetical protein
VAGGTEWREIFKGKRQRRIHRQADDMMHRLGRYNSRGVLFKWI